MNEIELLKGLIGASPYLALVIWMVFRQEKLLDKMNDRNESQGKIMTAALDRSTELHGRILERLAHSDAHQLRMGEIITDYNREMRREQ